MKHTMLIAASALLTLGVTTTQSQGLDSLLFCIDPGHGGHNPANDRHLIPDPGVDFWESESNFQKALLLKSLLEAQGATVILTRYTNDYPDDNLEPSLGARVALANANNADWFHSIHSNAIGNGMQTTTSVNFTLMLVREKRSLTDPAANTGDGLGVPERPESWTMATLMSPAIMSNLRTDSNMKYLDWTFYGGVNGGFSLGVLRGLLMPGELSEGSMHDYAPETRRLMNNDYRKMEEYALRNSFMQYYGVPPDSLGIIAGIQKDVTTATPVNYTRVRLEPGDRIYKGDSYNNGFYLFDSLQPGTYTVRFETRGYEVDSLQVSVADGSTNFVDRSLTSVGLPTVISSSPVNNDTAFALTRSIIVGFNKPMDTASVRSALSIVPPIAASLYWSNGNSLLTITPGSVLQSFQNYTLHLDTSAHSSLGQTLDGNGDGTPGDPFVLTFRTLLIDIVPPAITERFPDAGVVLTAPTDVLNLTFSEPLNPSTINTNDISFQQSGGTIIPRTFKYWENGGKSGVDVYLSTSLLPGASYLMRVTGIKDTAGNTIPTSSQNVWQFSLGSSNFNYDVIDAFDSSTADWLQPKESANTVGVDSASFLFSSTMSIPVVGSDSGSNELPISWDTTAREWLLREALAAGAGHLLQWRKENAVLEAYVFGDGSGNQLRFAVQDSNGFEVNGWTTINWVGWKMVQWDMSRDSIGSWMGDGSLDGNLTFDSFQFRYIPGTSAPEAHLFIDQLEVVHATPTTAAPEGAALPTSFELHQNYPNPFNPVTVISYQLPVVSDVKLVVYDVLGQEVAELVNGRQVPGKHEARFDGSDLASGVYFYRLEAGSFVGTRKLMLLK
jgi:N-acetylmuramoyl-L-alanine amidase